MKFIYWLSWQWHNWRSAVWDGQRAKHQGHRDGRFVVVSPQYFVAVKMHDYHAGQAFLFEFMYSDAGGEVPQPPERRWTPTPITGEAFRK